MVSHHYLQRTQIAIIFLSFALLALPLSYVQLSPSLPPAIVRTLILGYVVLLGNTHFAITWALYLNGRNLEYFQSSIGRRVVYFLIPIALMLLLAAIGMLDLPREGMLIFIPFTVALAAADFFHVVRQSFGVLQMFKARVGVRFPRTFSKADNAFFLSLFALQILTFTSGVSRGFDGRFDPSNPLTRAAVTIAAVLFVIVVRGLVGAWRQPGCDRGALLTASGYLLLQSASALLVVYRSRLYLPSLAMHYVEYHVLMAPRVFQSDVDPSSRVDRVSVALRRHKVLFYAALVAVATMVSSGGLLAAGGINVTRDNARFGWVFINLLNGIFLAHYFVEGFVWKFGNPFYRKTLAPLYFAPAPAVARDEPRNTRNTRKQKQTRVTS